MLNTRKIGINKDDQDMTHVMEYNISIPTHVPDFESFMVYMCISWGVVIVGMFTIALII